MKKSWEPFGSYQLNSTDNPAHFHSYWAGLALLFGRYITPKTAPMIFFIFSGYLKKICFIKKPQTTIALTFLTHIISAIGGV